MKITIKDAEQYIRLTLREHNADIKVSFDSRLGRAKRNWGEYHFKSSFDFSPKEIRLTDMILCSFDLFRHVFLHELAHYLDHRDRGCLRSKSGRMNGHGANFNRWCKKLGIQKGAYIPKKIFPDQKTLATMREQRIIRS